MRTDAAHPAVRPLGRVRAFAQFVPTAPHAARFVRSHHSPCWCDSRISRACQRGAMMCLRISCLANVATPGYHRYAAPRYQFRWRFCRGVLWLIRSATRRVYALCTRHHNNHDDDLDQRAALDGGQLHRLLFEIAATSRPDSTSASRQAQHSGMTFSARTFSGLRGIVPHYLARGHSRRCWGGVFFALGGLAFLMAWLAVQFCWHAGTRGFNSAAMGARAPRQIDGGISIARQWRAISASTATRGEWHNSPRLPASANTAFRPAIRLPLQTSG